jgi:hypothetical protein
MPPDLLVLLALAPVTYASTFLHELGHALAARLAGAVPTSFGMGTGRPFFAGSVGGCRVFLGARQPLCTASRLFSTPG